MKKFIGIITILLFGVVALCYASPPLTDSVTTIDVVQQDGTVTAAKSFIQDWEVPGKHTDVVVAIDELGAKESYLFASLSPAPQSEPPTVAVEEDTGGLFSNFSIETIISMLLLVVTTVFGTFWKKGKTKLSDGLELLEVVVTALEDDKLSATEITSIKQRYRKLVGKTA